MTNNYFWFQKYSAYTDSLFLYKNSIESSVYKKISLAKVSLFLSVPQVKNNKDFRPIKAFFLFRLFSQKKPKLLFEEKVISKTTQKEAKLSLFLTKKKLYAFFYFYNFMLLPHMQKRQLTYKPTFDSFGALALSITDWHLMTIKWLPYDYFNYKKKLFFLFYLSYKSQRESNYFWSFYKLQKPFNK